MYDFQVSQNKSTLGLSLFSSPEAYSGHNLGGLLELFSLDVNRMRKKVKQNFINLQSHG